MRFDRADIVVLFLLAAIAGGACFAGSGTISPLFYRPFDSNDIWFASDMPRVYSNMTKHDGNHHRSRVHPLFSLVTLPAVSALRLLSFEDSTAVRLVMAAVAALWCACLFALLRTMGTRRLDAALFCLMCASTAAAVFWLVVPETYALGSISLVAALLVVAMDEGNPGPSWRHVLAGILTLSFTITNWMAGILAAAASHRWRKVIALSLISFLCVLLLGGIQSILLPSSRSMLYLLDEINYVVPLSWERTLGVLCAFFLHSVIMPAIDIVDDPASPTLTMSIQRASVGGTPIRLAALGIWLVLLLLAAHALLTVRQHRRLRLVLFLTLLGQLSLHLVYGAETFLYSLHWTPFLIVCVSFGLLTPYRPLVLTLAGILTVLAALLNSRQLLDASEFFAKHASPRQELRAQMLSRPEGPWPRGEGHVVLARPGTLTSEKAYHEPGASFSPVVGSFGVSLWVVDRSGRLLASSDDIPLESLQQSLDWGGDPGVPAITTRTAWYQARWSTPSNDRRSLELTADPSLDGSMVLVVRSAGPAGGAVRMLRWENKSLFINDRWILQVDPSIESVHLGDERSSDWMEAPSGVDRWADDDGWGFARIDLGAGSRWSIAITSVEASSAPESTGSLRASLELELPDRRFEQSLHAQTAHLLMGLVDQEARPGDPVHYPLPWLRDGSYSIIALARAGHLAQSRRLAGFFAEHDFFGGLGPEADGPGLALWALEEVASRAGDPAFDRWLWPHASRKAELIRHMLEAKQPMRRDPFGPIVPRMKSRPELSLVALPAKEGLIVGRMDWHFPVLFVNAVSHKGLRCASTLAARLGMTEEARRWSALADEIREAWSMKLKQSRTSKVWQVRAGRVRDALEDLFSPVTEPTSLRRRIISFEHGLKRSIQQPTEWEDNRTYTSGLWPGEVSAGVKEFEEGLDELWHRQWDSSGNLERPLWTYFTVAQAHQWLLLGRSERTWATLNWFWDHQASPGLYTWWEGQNEVNTFHQWDRIRGWANPRHITPHYWTAAEMLLLQLDMLGHLEAGAEDPALILGAGIPPGWLSESMGVKGLSFPGASVDWRWDKGTMRVKIHGREMRVRLGAAFPPATPLVVETGS